MRINSLVYYRSVEKDDDRDDDDDDNINKNLNENGQIIFNGNVFT